MPRTCRLAFVAFASMLFASSAALADTLSLTLANPNQSGSSGTTLSFNATVSAPLTNTADVYLNGLDYTLAYPTLTFNGDAFNSFPFSLSAGASYTGLLFTVASTSGTLPALYSGSVVLLGGSTDGSQDRLTTAAFSDRVTGAAAVTPEPSSLLLLGSGAMGLLGFLGRRYNAARNG